jgi:Protein of unknown function (DUF559)
VNSAVDALFSRQLGLITRRQAVETGVSRRQLDRLVGGDWVAVHSGVYRHRACPASREQFLLAAVLKAGPGSAVSHRAAVHVHGLRNYRCDMAEISRPGRSSVRMSGVVLHRSLDLVPAQVCIVGNLPVTTPVRTLVDLGAVVSRLLVARCLEEWLARRVTTIAEVRKGLQVQGGHGRIGTGVLRAVLDVRVLADLEPDSVDEGLLAEILVRHGLPMPALHHLVVLDSGLVYELDWSYPELMVAFELDGYGIQLRSLEAFENDRDRSNELHIAGWRVLRFTSRSVRQHPARVVSQVKRLLVSSTAA